MMILGADLSIPESPQAKFWAWVVGLVLGTAAVLIGLDATFMRKAEGADLRLQTAADIKAQTQHLSIENQLTRLGSEINYLQLRKATLQDRVYDMAARNNMRGAQPLTLPERASFERYKAELEEVLADIQRKKRQLEQLQAAVR